jgi:CPA2 family monovalent cation:H+ antiporter-2
VIHATLVAAMAASSGSVEVLVDVVIVLALCVAFGLAAQRLGQSVLVGYLLAGVVAGGPSSLGIVDDIGSFSFMGEVGVALLLFTVGLDLPFHKVRRFGSTAIVAGTLQVALATAAVAAVAVATGTSGSAAFIIGVAVSLSSTAVVIRVLADRAETDSVHGMVTTGILIAQDVLVVLVLILIPLLPGAEGGGGGSFALELGTALLKLAGLVSAVVLTERIVLRRMFRNTRFDGARELLAVSSITVSLGAIGACWALDLSPALGGFIAGIVMADAPYAAQVRAEIAPIRMGLTAIFFAYVGMLADAGWMLEHAWLIAIVVVPVVLGKALITWAAATVARVPSAAAVMTAAALAQLGEFSFAVLTTGVVVGLVEDETFRLMVSVSLVTLLLTPAVIAAASHAIHRRTLAGGADLDLADDDVDVEHAMGGHAIVVGVGPAGRAVTTALAGADVPVTVIELNPRAETGGTDDDLPSGTRVVFGDAARAEILARANVASARILVVTIPDPVAIRTIVAQSRQVAPGVPIVARGRYNRYVEEIAEAGADEVVDEENITGTELARVALHRLATAGAVDRRRGPGRDRRARD